MALQSISNFFPAGTQMEAPGGLWIDPHKLAAVEANEGLRGEEYLRLHTEKGVVDVKFYNCVGGGRAKIYDIARSIVEASKS